MNLHDYCEFGDDRVYILVAIARSTDNEDIRASNQPTMRKVVEDEEELDDKIEQLEHAVSRFDVDYRLYCTVNARDAVKGAFILCDQMDTILRDATVGNGSLDGFKRIDHKWKSTLHTPAARADKRMLVDLDDSSGTARRAMFSLLEEVTEIVEGTPSPNGYHFIVEPFNYTEVDIDVDFEIKTDDMVFVRYL